MFWDKKEEKKGLPELPSMRPPLKPLEEGAEAVESHNLSQFPEPRKEEFSGLPSRFKTQTMPERGEFTSRRMNAESRPSEKNEDVYIKIERFNSARKALNSAREKLREIEEVMRKIRETRMREEQELASWEKEIDSVKTKVEDVTKSIFEKTE